MKMCKNVIVLLLSIGSVYASALYRPLNLILIIDSKDETIGGPLTNDLTIAIKQKVSSIIVSENVLYNFFALRETITPQALKELRELLHKNETELKKLESLSAETFNREALQTLEQNYQNQKNLIQQKYDSTTTILSKLTNIPPMAQDSIKPLHELSTIVQEGIEQLPEDSVVKEKLQEFLMILLKLPKIIQEYFDAEKSEPQTITELNRLHNQQRERLREYSEKVDELHKKIREALTLSLKESKKALDVLSRQSTEAISNFRVGYEQKSQELIVKTKEILETQLKMKEKQANIFYKNISFILSDWLILKLGSAPFYILIPKSFMAESEKALKQLRIAAASENEAKEAAEEKGGKEAKGTLENYTDQELAVGLAFNHPEIMQPIPSSITTEKDFLQFLVDHMTFKMGIDALRQSSLLSTESSIKIDAIQACFIPKQYLHYSFWNIYMIGHGMYKKIITPQQQYEFVTKTREQAIKTSVMLHFVLRTLPKEENTPSKQEIDKFNKEMNRLFIAYLIAMNQNVFDPDEEVAELFLQIFLERHPLVVNLIKDQSIDPIIENQLLLAKFVEAFIEQLTSETLELYKESERLQAEVKSGKTVEYPPVIAGLKLEQEKALLRFLTQSVNTSFLYIITCFGEGFNAEQIRQYITQLEKSEKRTLADVPSNFIIALGSLTDATVYSFNRDEKLIPLNF